MRTGKMPVQIKIGGQKKQVSTTSKVRKTLDGNLTFFDHKDMIIILSPEKRKVVAMPSQNISKNLYDIQNLLFQILIEKGVIDPASVRAGNIYGAIEGTIPQETAEAPDGIETTLFVISQWLEEQSEMFKYIEDMENKEEEEAVNPEPDEVTRHGEIPPPNTDAFRKTPTPQYVYEAKNK